MANHQRFYDDMTALHNEVSGSSILNAVKFPLDLKRNILIDCGLFQEPEYYDLNPTLPFKAENIDYVIVTHAHTDHIGRLPLLIHKGYRGKIYTSHDTAILLPYSLYDNFKVMMLNAKFSNTPPLYSEEDVKLTLNAIKPIPFENTISLDDNIKINLFKNGHLPGAASVLTRFTCHTHGRDKGNYQKDINLLYTGDYKGKSIFLDAPALPRWLRQLPLTIIQEATYGYMDSSEIEYVFEENILKAILEGKEVFIPVLSLGRSQEVLYFLRKWQDEGKLDKNIPIYYEGKLGMRYTQLYSSGMLDIKKECVDFLPANLTFVTNPDIRKKVIEDGKFKILLASSGMASHGPAQFYLPIFAGRKNCLIHFTCYLAEGTAGRKLMETPNNDTVELFGIKIIKKATTKTTSEFSAHAKKDELARYLRNFENIKELFINHGSIHSKDAYSDYIIKEGIVKEVISLSREYFYRVNGSGLIKACTTKFM